MARTEIPGFLHCGQGALDCCDRARRYDQTMKDARSAAPGSAVHGSPRRTGGQTMALVRRMMGVAPPGIATLGSRNACRSFAPHDRHARECAQLASESLDVACRRWYPTSPQRPQYAGRPGCSRPWRRNSESSRPVSRFASRASSGCRQISSTPSLVTTSRTAPRPCGGSRPRNTTASAQEACGINHGSEP